MRRARAASPARDAPPGPGLEPVSEVATAGVDRLLAPCATRSLADAPASTPLACVAWVEVDVRLTAAGELVASHDPITAPPPQELMRIEELLEDLPTEIGVNLEIKTALADAQRPRRETTGARTAELAASAKPRP